MRQPQTQQARCHGPSYPGRCFSRLKSISQAGKSHGFEFVRTLWCVGQTFLSVTGGMTNDHTWLSQSADIFASDRQANLTDRQECLSYRFTVTLRVPTLPLLSNERSEIVCSPGARRGNPKE